ncbi:hypothetical protein MKX01_039703 [Papaver californicum]|nr:hypothetical protein MKX01_039703 [Papaver californicum]
MISTKSHGGERSDLATFYKTHKAYEFRREKEVPTDHASVKPQGIPQVFVVWFLALFPDVLKMFRRKLDIKGPHPLIITVLCERVISFKRLRKVMKQAVRSP